MGRQGYWAAGYFGANQWNEDYWFENPSVVVDEEITGGGAGKSKPHRRQRKPSVVKFPHHQERIRDFPTLVPEPEPPRPRPTPIIPFPKPEPPAPEPPPIAAKKIEDTNHFVEMLTPDFELPFREVFSHAKSVKGKTKRVKVVSPLLGEEFEIELPDDTDLEQALMIAALAIGEDEMAVMASSI